MMALCVAVLLTSSAFAEDKKAEDKKKEEKKQQELLKKQQEEEKKAKPKKKEHADLDNIGNRNINSGLNWFVPNIESEIQQGRQAAKELEQGVTLVTDPTINEYINRVGQNIVKNSDAKVPFTIKVIESDEINAVSLPGGFFYINTGLILAAEDEAELAGVMAHEIAHVTARHAMEQQGKASMFNIATIPASIFLGGLPAMIVQNALAVGVPITFLAFGRGAEEEADWLGLQYLYKSGYDPGASVSFFEKLQAKESARKKVSSLFSTHPATDDRVKEVKENIEQFLPAREQYVVTTSEFQRVKAQLARLESQAGPKERERGPSLRQPNRRNPTRDDDSDSTDPSDRDPGATPRPEDREPDADAPPVLRRPQERQLTEKF
jgi:predicted Zn-dependent protease